GGTDATRVASYNPWVSLYWMITGRTIGGLRLYPEHNTLDRETALRLWTQGSAWFSGEADRKGALTAGQYADLAVLSEDLMSVPEADIQRIESVLTVVGGRIVYGAGDFSDQSPELPPAMPDWSPVDRYQGAYNPARPSAAPNAAAATQRGCHEGCRNHCSLHGHDHGIAWNTPIPTRDLTAFWGALGCSCFAF
ncbi:MAG: amidohydrolase family protein, partial [Pseudomonadota bacterium]